MKTIITLKVTMSTIIYLFFVLSIQAQSKHNITVTSNMFTPASLTIDVGDTVVWNNVSGFHNVNGTQATYPSNPESFGNSTGTGWTYSYVFNTSGEYDYQCDPHVGLGMIGKIIVTNTPIITVNFSSMAPHVGQDLWLAIIEQESGKELERQHLVVTESFSITSSMLAFGKGYYLDFFADHNGNGYYDAPPADHAWRLEFDDLENGNTQDFAHNTSFTDIEWSHKATVNFLEMDPHNGQNFWFALIDKDTDLEIAREMLTVESTFSAEIFGIEPGESYYINFFADHTGNGKYDAPPTDHAWQLNLDNVMGDTILNFTHNTEFTDIEWQHKIKVNFSDMDPHNGQVLWLAVIDNATYQEIKRVKVIIEPEFSIEVGGIEPGLDYHVDFFADLNANGYYDAPPTDHVWRLAVDDAQDYNELDFIHNVDFTDIKWKHKLEVNFMAMNPHMGQDFWLSVFDKTTGKEIDRQMSEITEEFSIEVLGIVPDSSYFINFYADHNENGYYDAPPTDHAWQLNLDNVMGDTALDFSHNTNFTDIVWSHFAVINFTGMDPHDGQNFWLSLIDKNTDLEITRQMFTVESEFSAEVFGIEPGKSYHVNFFADHNGNGKYDAPPTDHAWQLNLDNIIDDTTLNFAHNTDFTDIEWQHKIRVNFSDMDPHNGQELWLALIDKSSYEEISRVKVIVESNFSIELDGIEPGNDYKIDFFADLNENGYYDKPPSDHAWRLEVANAKDFNELDFAHNTSFTDIGWMHKATVNFKDMDPHVGQLFKLYQFDVTNEKYIDTVAFDPIASASYSIDLYVIPKSTYNIDFFADLNGNNSYDAPPADHAWRIVLENVMGDTTITFSHNTNFTNIFETEPNSISSFNSNDLIQIYPNPAYGNISIILGDNIPENIQVQLKIINTAGQIVLKEKFTNNNSLNLNTSNLKSGLYIVHLQYDTHLISSKLSIKN